MTYLFVFISVLGLLAALGTVLARNLVHAGLFLVAFFFTVACQFVLLEAEFLAAVQVLVYIGAVAILLMFAIMLTRNVQGDMTTTTSRTWLLPALVGGLGLFFVLMFGINDQVGLKGRMTWASASTRPEIPRAGEGKPVTPRSAAINDMGRMVGREMVTRFVVPFEVAGLLLTAALVGAVVVAYREGDDAESPRRGIQPTRLHGAVTVQATNGHADGSDLPSTASVTS